MALSCKDRKDRPAMAVELEQVMDVSPMLATEVWMVYAFDIH
jgi:hypothetical protein